jgi:hypothetical protein
MRRARAGLGIVVLLLAAAAQPVSAAPRFDLSAPAKPLLGGVWLADRHHVPQSFAFDERNGFIYILQVEGTDAAGSFADHSARGDLTLTRLRRADGALAGHMTLRGFGHGVSLGVEPAGGAVFLWTEVDSEPVASGSGRGRRLGRFRFIDGATLDRSSRDIARFELVPGAQACTPSLDLSHGRLAMKYVATDGRTHAALFDFAAVKRGAPVPIRDIVFPARLGTLQGWCTFGDFVYVWCGEAYGPTNPPPGDATLWCIEWSTGRVVDRRHSDALGALAVREPEGLAVEVGPDGPALCFGFGAAVSADDPRRRCHIVRLTALVPDTESVEERFKAPPAAARPVTFWWWFNSHVTGEGITRDLAEFKAKGLGGVVLINTSTGFGAGTIPAGPKFLSPEWRALYRFALQEASRLGLEVGVNLSTGWCMGGPWIKPEESGRWFLQSELVVTGPSRFSGVLPLPDSRSGYDNAGQLAVKKYVGLPLAQLDYRFLYDYRHAVADLMADAHYGRLAAFWSAPWQVEITSAARPGANELEIDIVNLWPNRLIGDKYLPAQRRLTRTNIPLHDEAALLPSGLLGPVMLREGAVAR